MKEITIYDWEGESTTFEVDLSKVKAIIIDIISGDEIASVKYDDENVEVYDSSTSRTHDFYDSTYTIYNPEKGINLLDNEEWLASTDSYDRYWK